MFVYLIGSYSHQLSLIPAGAGVTSPTIAVVAAVELPEAAVNTPDLHGAAHKSHDPATKV